MNIRSAVRNKLRLSMHFFSSNIPGTQNARYKQTLNHNSIPAPFSEQLLNDKLRNTVLISPTTLLSENVPTLLPARAVGPKPFHSTGGLVKLFVVTALSLYLGGLIAHKGASYLEENEIFIPSDEDNDD